MSAAIEKDFLIGLGMLIPGFNLKDQLASLTEEQLETARGYFQSRRDCALMSIESLAELMTAHDETVNDLSIGRLGWVLRDLVNKAVEGEVIGGEADNHLFVRSRKS